MFKSLKRIVYPVPDVESAKQWYNKILNETPLFDTPVAAVYLIGDCSLSLKKSDAVAVADANQVETYWEVDDIDTVYQKMIDSGATIHTAINHVLNIRIARVIDPFGNIIGLTEQQTNKDQTVETNPSETALTVALCRAIAAKEDRQEIKGPDNLAELFLQDDTRKNLTDAESRRMMVKNFISSQLYGYFLSRTAFIENIFIKSLLENISQIVFLGAGYDTRAYRHRELIGNTRIFELDIHSTQKRKIDILKSNNIAVPPRLTFVEINFKVDDIAATLEKAGYLSNATTLFIWEGVTYYLTEDMIKNTLNFIGNNSAAGSTLCFDYMSKKMISVNPSEPFIFFIDRTEIEAFLKNYGFEIIEHVDSEEMERRLLTLSDGNLAEKSLAQFCLVNAKLK